MRQPNEKRHRDRKNPGSAEFFRKQKKERNAARPKQIWIESQIFNPETGQFIRDAHWSRG
jgi:hypothetical protein